MAGDSAGHIRNYVYIEELFSIKPCQGIAFPTEVLNIARDTKKLLKLS
jgi:hypothetical protein